MWPIPIQKTERSPSRKEYKPGYLGPVSLRINRDSLKLIKLLKEKTGVKGQHHLLLFRELRLKRVIILLPLMAQTYLPLMIFTKLLPENEELFFRIYL